VVCLKACVLRHFLLVGYNGSKSVPLKMPTKMFANPSMSKPKQPDENQYVIDPEHGPMRVAFVPIMVVGAFLSYMVMAPLLDPSGLNCVAMLFALFIGLLIAAISSRLIRAIWPGPRSLLMNSGTLTLQDKRHATANTIILTQQFNVLAWRFTVRQTSMRVPRGWMMMGCQVSQGEQTLVLYTFVPAKEADQERYEHFTALVSRKSLETGNFSLRDSKHYRRLLDAENDRWHNGGEMQRRDFADMLDHLLNNKPEWEDIPSPINHRSTP
jgi:hypothetical protein